MSILDTAHQELRDELRASTREMLNAHSNSAQVRALAKTDGGFDDALWQRFSMQGWAAIEVGEELGGGGGSFGDVAVILVELGRRLCSNGFMPTAALGAGALLGSEQDSRVTHWLRRLCDGGLRITAVVGGAGSDDLRAVGRGEGWVVDGSASLVADAVGSDLVMLPATAEDGAGLLFAVAPTAPGLTWLDAPMLDVTRRFADLEVKGLDVGKGELLARGSAADTLIADLLDRAALATACDAFGAAEQALDLTVGYAKERVQFGRPIGSFQAVKHRCADMYIAVETARAALEQAIDAYDAAPTAATVAISRAKAYCCDAAAQVAEDAVELHGGIGFTWEHDLHLYVKRVRLDQALFGDSRWHRRRVAALTLD